MDKAYFDHPKHRLRGLCAYSDIDTIYTPKNYGKDGELMFVGYDHNQIIYDYATSQWEITKLSVTGNFTRAVTKASLASMAIGTNVWTVFNDSKRCVKTKRPDCSSLIQFKMT